MLTYKTAILPIIEYANITHTLLTKSISRKLQRLQNRALNIIYYSHYLPVQERQAMEELHMLAKIEPVRQRADRQLICLMFRRSHDACRYPQITGSENSNTRASRKIRFEVPKPKTERFKQFPHYRGAKLWDSLEASTQQILSYESFKRSIPKVPNFNLYPV